MSPGKKDEGKTPQGALPLSGINVLDLSAVVMGPYCTQMLADLGAEVIKVESIEGDIIRNVGPGKTPGMAAMFLACNRGKKSIALDLTNPKAREAINGLIKGADIFIHSMRPAGLAKMGLDYESVRKIEPQIIYCALTGFGLSGPYAGKPAYDDIIQSASGLTALEGEIRGTPGYTATVVADKVSALTAMYSIMAGLLHRGRTGIGQYIEVPMFETMVSFNLVEHLSGAIYADPISRPLYTRVVSPYRRPYSTTTDYISALVHTDHHFQKFCDIIGRPELKSDDRFLNVNGRIRNVNAYYQFLESEFAKRSANEWVTLLEAAEIPVQKIISTDELFKDPHLKQVGFFKEIEQQEVGTLRVPGSPVHFSETPARVCAGVPRLGEHTIELLRQAEQSADDIEALLASGAALSSPALGRNDATRSAASAKAS
jgi:crotonobetainyl-CoA:carnitine CoA-transferase CaiB-like acyl-CoA transferase